MFQALVNIATEMNVDRMAVISADYRATKALLSEAADKRILVEDVYEYDTQHLVGYNFTQVCPLIQTFAVCLEKNPSFVYRAN